MKEKHRQKLVAILSVVYLSKFVLTSHTCTVTYLYPSTILLQLIVVPATALSIY